MSSSINACVIPSALAVAYFGASIRAGRDDYVLKFVLMSTAIGVLTLIMTGRSAAQPAAVAPYTVTTFATAPSGLSAPDSVTFSASNVFIGYGNGGAPDGSGGAMSDVVEYDFKGNE